MRSPTQGKARRWWWVVAAVFAAAGCSAPSRPAPTAGASAPGEAPAPSTSPSGAQRTPTTAAPSAAPVSAAAIDAWVHELMTKAATVEPAVTAQLQQLADEVGGELIKLEYRLKTESSAKRKVRARLIDHPELRPRQVVLDDCLRYTLEVADQPPGHHVEVIKKVLTALKAKGHEVVRLKNYWPDDDNYSGVNSVLRAPNGLPWELQFHTPESIATAARTRDWYEELRCVATPVERKRELFDRMTQEWNRVPIPAGILEPDALGPHDDIIERPRP